LRDESEEWLEVLDAQCNYSKIQILGMDELPEYLDRQNSSFISLAYDYNTSTN
jgi:hypothetical protein